MLQSEIIDRKEGSVMAKRNINNMSLPYMRNLEPTIENADTLEPAGSGKFRADNSTRGLPPREELPISTSHLGGQILQLRWDSNTTTQMYFPRCSDAIFARSLQDKSWQDWKKIKFSN